MFPFNLNFITYIKQFQNQDTSKVFIHKVSKSNGYLIQIKQLKKMNIFNLNPLQTSSEYIRDLSYIQIKKKRIIKRNSNNIYIINSSNSGLFAQMNISQVEQEDVLTNILIRSKKIINQGIQLQLDSKLNYKRIYDNPKEYQVSYVDALANLQEIKQLFKKSISDKNINYNFFLDDSQNPNNMQQITPEQYGKYQQYLKNGKVFAYTLKDTWTKGKQFFFIEKGCVLQVKKIYQDRIFVDVEYKKQIGLMKMEELKIILANDQN